MASTNLKTKTMKHFEFTTPTFKNFTIDGKPYPCKIGEWAIEGIADIVNANNLDFTWHLLSMTFKKSEFEQHEIGYEDFYLSEETLSEIISQHLHSKYQTRFVT